MRIDILALLAGWCISMGMNMILIYNNIWAGMGWWGASIILFITTILLHKQRNIKGEKG